MIRECSSSATVENIYRYSGGIVGYLKESSATKGFIYGCVFSGTVRECYEQTGGIAGRNERGVISKCVNLGKVEAQSFDSLREPDKQSTGAGIAGYNYFGTVENCMNAGHVYVSYQKAGGIVGYNSNADCDVHGCINTGRIDTPDKRYVGAIVAHNFRSGTAPNFKYATVADCYYDSQLRGDPEMIAGYQIPESGQTALPTLSFTSGETLAGIPAEHWTYTKGFYPRVSVSSMAEAVKEAAAAYVVFPAGTTASDFSGSAVISTAMPGIKASMAAGEWFSIADGRITAGNPPAAVSNTILLAQSLYSTAIPVMRVPVLFEGEGTEASPYLITNKAQLKELAARCNGERIEHFEGVWFRQTADIDMAGTSGFDGIASKATNAFNSELTYYFAGHYDGGGFAIRNLRIAGVLFDANGTALEYTRGSNGNVGLFGALGKGAEVSNVRLTDADIEGYYNVGGIAGFIGDGASISDCEVSGVIKAYNKAAGGIAGSSNAAAGSTTISVSRCSVSGKVMANSEIAGGIVGYNHAVVSECANMADVSVAKFNDCVATPKLVEAGGIAGGIVGITTVNAGDEITTLIDGCGNEGTVAGLTSIGGIAGVAANGCSITSSYNTSEVKPMMGRGGGIIGEVSQKVSVDRCFNTGEIEASMNAGGIVGEAPSGSALTISRSFNAGNITAGANGSASGIANCTGGTTAVSDCYNTGDITTARYVTGITGRSTGTTITRCYSSGTVTANSSNEQYRNTAGHISADPSSKPTVVSSCFYAPLRPQAGRPACGRSGRNDGGGALRERRRARRRIRLRPALPAPTRSLGRDRRSQGQFSLFHPLRRRHTRAREQSDHAGQPQRHRMERRGTIGISDGYAYPQADGEGSITARAGAFSRTYPLTTRLMHGVDSVDSDTQLTIEWFTLDGRRTFTPRPGEVIVEVTTGADGKRVARKVIVSESGN